MDLNLSKNVRVQGWISAPQRGGGCGGDQSLRLSREPTTTETPLDKRLKTFSERNIPLT